MQPNAEAEKSFRATYVSRHDSPRLTEVITAPDVETAEAKAEDRADAINEKRYKARLSMHRYDYTVDKVDEIGGTR